MGTWMHLQIVGPVGPEAVERGIGFGARYSQQSRERQRKIMDWMHAKHSLKLYGYTDTPEEEGRIRAAAEARYQHAVQELDRADRERAIASLQKSNHQWSADTQSDIEAEMRKIASQRAEATWKGDIDYARRNWEENNQLWVEVSDDGRLILS